MEIRRHSQFTGVTFKCSIHKVFASVTAVTVKMKTISRDNLQPFIPNKGIDILLDCFNIIFIKFSVTSVT